MRSLADTAAGGASGRAAAAGVGAPSAARSAGHETATMRAFIQQMLPVARAVHQRWNVPTSVVIAQAALESGWGTSHPGNEYFGVKSHGTTGRTTSIETHEVDASGRHAERDSFRAYGSLAEAADDYGRFMTAQPRYAEAFRHSDDPHRFVQEIGRAGWGTDPAYAAKVNQIIDRHHLTQYDAPAPSAATLAQGRM
jgi:flagellar protein FlgJ